MILGISCLLIGLVAIVILQILKSKYVEGFVFNNGAGCKENKCKLTKSKISEADYKEWCDQCDNCLWDDVAKDCNPNPDLEGSDTDPTDGLAPSGSNIDETSDSSTPMNTQTKTAKDVTPEESLRRMEELHNKNRNLPSDDIDYSITESEETSIAKEKNRQAKFLQDFQSIVHNELLNEQGMTTANSQPYLKEKKERLSANLKPNQKKGCPDMSEYVRKDSIPCWGCNLE